VEFIASILGLLGGSCDCLVTIFVIVGGVWFFVIREKSANTANKALDTVGAAFDDDEEDDVATIVAPQPKSASEEPKVKLARPPRSAGATIIAFDDDDLLDD
jgi:hypothetical protein